MKSSLCRDHYDDDDDDDNDSCISWLVNH